MLKQPPSSRPCATITGRVVASDGKGSTIAVATPRCESCTGHCALRLGNGSMRVPERLPVGEPVSIAIDRAAVDRASGLVFGLPLVAMLLGAVLGVGLDASGAAATNAPAIGMGVGFVAGAMAAIFVGRRIRLQPGIVKPNPTPSPDAPRMRTQ